MADVETKAIYPYPSELGNVRDGLETLPISKKYSPLAERYPIRKRLPVAVGKLQQNALVTSPVGIASNQEIQTSDETLHPRHETLSAKQEEIAFEFLKRGSTLGELMRTNEFREGISTEERTQFQRVLGICESVEDFIVVNNLYLVKFVARATPSVSVSFEDRVAAGNLGLFYAVRKFDYTRGGRFSSMAVWDIRTAIRDSIRKEQSPIWYPKPVQQAIGKARRIMGAFEHLFGREPTIDELRQQMVAITDFSLAYIDVALRVLKFNIESIESLQERYYGDNETEVSDYIPDRKIDIEATAIKHIGRQDLNREIQRALRAHLTDEERLVISGLYGLEGREKTPSELVQETGSNRWLVKAIERRGLAKLRSDERLRERWAEDAPSFIYRLSAEDAAFRLGLFEDPNLKERLISPQSEVPILLQAVQIQEAIDLGKAVGMNDTVSLADLANRNDGEIGLPQGGSKQGTKRAAIAELRGQGLSYSEIAEKLEIPRGTVSSVLSSKEGSKTGSVSVSGLAGEGSQRGLLTREVADLRNQGLDNMQVAERLHLGHKTITDITSRLVKAGVIKPLKIEADWDDTIDLRTKIAELRNRWVGNIEIAIVLTQPLTRINKIASELNRSGEIDRLRPERQSIDRSVFISGETEAVGKYLEDHPTPSYYETFKRALGAQRRTKEENDGEVAAAHVEVSDSAELLEQRIQISDQGGASTSLATTIPADAKAFYTINDIVKDLGVKPHVVRKILEDARLQRAKISHKHRHDTGEDKRRQASMHFSYQEYQVVKGIVQTASQK